MSSAGDFYARVYKEDQYSNDDTAEKHPFAPTLRRFLDRHRLGGAKCVEIGSGRGAFQDVVADYTGADYSSSVAHYYHKPFHNASCEALPFPDNSFDVAWSYAVLEHVGDPEKALREVRRVVRPGGLILLEPAWQCRSWAADGYPVRPYSDFGYWGRLIKASIPFRDTVLFRSAYIFPRRLFHLLRYLLGGRRPIPFRYTRLKANFETFWMSDSDAQNSMDPFDALLFFDSLGDRCENYPTMASKFMIRTGPVEIRVCKPAVPG